MSAQDTLKQPFPYSLPKEKIKILLLEGISETAVNVLRAAGYTQIDRRTKALDGAGLARGARRRAPARHPLAHADHRRGDRRHPLAGGDRLLLGRHQPGRSRRLPHHGHPGLQRAVLQHALGRRADHGRDRHADAAHLPEVGVRARRRLGQERGRLQRGARQDARHRRLRQHRHPARRASPRRWACA